MSRRRVVLILGTQPRVIDPSTGREIAHLRYVENFGWRVMPLVSIGEPSRRWYRDPFSACVARGWVPSIAPTCATEAALA